MRETVGDNTLASLRIGVEYRSVLLFALIGVSLMPPLVAVLNFEITNASVYAITLSWSLLTVLGGAHVWITLAYYCDLRWLSRFRQQPVLFFLVPVTLVAASTALMLQYSMIVGLVLVYGAILLNMWHHAKQNWGILALIGRSRSCEVAALRLPLVYAWPFFLASICLYLPKLTGVTGALPLRSAALALAGAYVLLCGVALWRARELADRDPLLYLLATCLCLYFLPLATMQGKPYALLITLGAHALQYYLLVFMSLSLSGRRLVDVRALVLKGIIVAAVIVAATFAGYRASLSYGPPDLWESLTVRLVVGLTTGVNLVHFWLDALIWKFSDKRTREAHGEAFAF
jgi:hypothetical protein